MAADLWRKIDVAWFVLREAIRSFFRNRGLEKAAVLAYNSFFALFAVLLLVLFVVGQVMASSQAAMGAVERMAAQLFPLGSDSIMAEVRALSEKRVWGLLSLPILLWTVAPLASAMRGAFDQAHGREEQRAFFKERLLDALAVMLLLVLLVLLVISEIAYAVVIALLAGRMPFLVRAVDVVLPIVIAVGLLSFLHYAFAPGRAKWGASLAGALVTAILLALIGPVMTAFMRFNPSFGVAFGSLKAVFILLLWVHAAFAAILIGVEVAAHVLRREALLVRELFEAKGNLHRNIRRLGRMAEVYEAGSVVFREGEPGESLYFIIEGSVELSKGSQVLRIMKAGEYFGEMALLLKAGRAATARTRDEGATLIPISAANMDRVLVQNPRIVMALLREMAERLRATDAMLKE